MIDIEYFYWHKIDYSKMIISDVVRPHPPYLADELRANFDLVTIQHIDRYGWPSVPKLAIRTIDGKFLKVDLILKRALHEIYTRKDFMWRCGYYLRSTKQYLMDTVPKVTGKFGIRSMRRRRTK